MRSVKLQTNLCVSPSCDSSSIFICRHCSQQFCQLCFMCHRKNILDDMQSISAQMKTNRQQGMMEVLSFIDKQAKDAHDQAKKLVDDAIERIVKASKNIYTYIENRRQAKLVRLEECLEKFDKDAEILQSKLKEQTFLPADAMIDLRKKYAYNMFDSLNQTIETTPNENQRLNEKFFDDYRFYHEMINLRQKWSFLQAALTTVYYPGKKEISLDKILTFLEYRHDRVLENYREHLVKHNESKDSALKPAEDLIHDLSFLSRKSILTENENFTLIPVASNEIQVEVSQLSPMTESKLDSGHCDDDETSSNSTSSWQVEDPIDEDYGSRIEKLTKSMKILEKQFDHDFRPFTNPEPIN